MIDSTEIGTKPVNRLSDHDNTTRSKASRLKSESARTSRPEDPPAKGGLPVPRVFTQVGSDPFDGVKWEKR
ncbi:MAG: hypothetical protein U1E27_00875, partial [Kiritimatiellia bacterium]|nr:hypothetical protein [Kiritimatiellia bacterium]